MRAERLSNLMRYEEELTKISEDYTQEMAGPDYLDPDEEEEFPDGDMYNIPNRGSSHGSYWIPL